MEIDVVRGRQIERTEGAVLRARAGRAERVVVDLGTGDGRALLRLARAHPTWLVVGVDANAGSMREASSRAARKPARGGAGNAVFVRAPAESLPSSLDGIADEVRIAYPWGSLLRAALGEDEETLRAIARLGRPGARITVRINGSALADGGAPNGRRIRTTYLAAGIVVEVRESAGARDSSWGRRVRGSVMAIDGEWPRDAAG